MSDEIEYKDIILSTSGLLAFFNERSGVDINGGDLFISHQRSELSPPEISKSIFDIAFINASDSTVRIDNLPLDTIAVEFFRYLPFNSSTNWVGIFQAEYQEGSGAFSGWFADERDDGGSGFPAYVGSSLVHSDPWDDNGNYVLYRPEHFLVMVNGSGTGLDLWRDGNVISSIGIGHIVKDGSQSVLIGNMTTSSQSYFPPNSDHYISNIAVYDRRLTQEEIDKRVNFQYNPSSTLAPMKIELFKAVWSNKETISEANYQKDKLEFLEYRNTKNLIGKSGNYKTLIDKNGNQKKYGHYESVVLIDSVPSSGKRVFCFENNGQLIDQTVSDEFGLYRFDYLDLNNKYMFIAQYSNDLNTPPSYSAIAADWQTPTPYKE